MSGDTDGAFSEIIAAEKFDDVEHIVALYENAPDANPEDQTPSDRWTFTRYVALGCIALITIGWVVMLILIGLPVIAAP